jgi:hypothetical protein
MSNRYLVNVSDPNDPEQDMLALLAFTVQLIPCAPGRAIVNDITPL